MTKDNSTGKNKEFYDLGKKMFDRIQVLPEHQAMNREDIFRMARQAGSLIEAVQEKDLQWLERFATLVASAEREACAEMCDYVYENIVTDEHIKDMAFKIRARGTEKNT
jgi:hypothetical protein